jgi:hypothetical protein
VFVRGSELVFPYPRLSALIRGKLFIHVIRELDPLLYFRVDIFH